MSNALFKFEKARREKCKASIMIEGLTGRGKSGLALLIAYGLTNDWNKVFDIDTENKSANLFVGIGCSNGDTFGEFNVGQLTPDIGFKPTNYLAFKDVAVQNGAEVVIEDSISHAWNYKGGILDLLNEAKAKNTRFAKDSYAAWSDETVAKEKNELLQLLRDPRCHVITTVRVKEKMEYSYDVDGKAKLVSLGEQQIQQADLKYEPDLVLHMLKAGKNKNGVVSHPVAKVIKSRYAIFDEGEEYEFTPALIEQLRKYLDEGIDPTELLEQQRQDYIAAVTEYLNEHPNAKNIWKVLKADAGYKDTKLTEMPLDAIKHIYIKLID